MGYFVISPIIGTGTSGDAYRASVSAYGNQVSVISDDNEWALTMSEADPTVVDADATLLRIPDNKLDNTITSQRANLINNRLSAYGVPALVTGGMTILEAVNTVGGYLSPGWSYSYDSFHA